MQDPSISVRIRRQKTTYFITCTLYQAIDSLKRKLLVFHKGTQPTQLRMYHAGKLLDDKSNIHDQGITNNALIYYKLKKGNSGEWQDIPEVVF